MSNQKTREVKVVIMEVHKSVRFVEATEDMSKDDIIDVAMGTTETSLEYSHTLEDDECSIVYDPWTS